MGVDPPFIYDRPSNYSFNGPTQKGFNPKAATQASWVPPAPMPKRDGPLIDFNKHPDTYVVVPYDNLNVQPLNPNTKNKVKKARAAQLFLRICALIGALGMLFCVITITKTTASVGWIIRLAPAVAVLHTVYAVYHLSRSATGRTPATTASYMLFALLIDAGLVPFFVFSALMARSDYTSNAYGWSTLFNTSEISYKIIFGFFLVCVIEGGLMAVSLVLSIYLTTMFRKIAKMPPDMNPLEPNLTARPNHKRNKSEMTSEKHLSGSTVSSRNRVSNQADPMIAGTRRVPFLHTRTDSADSVTLYGNSSARNSKIALEEKEESSYRKSQLSQEVEGVPRPVSSINPPANSRNPGSAIGQNSSRSPVAVQQRRNKTPSWLSYLDFEGVPRAVSGNAACLLNAQVPAPAPVSQPPSHRAVPEALYAEGKNWFEKSPRHDHLESSALIHSMPTSPELTPQPLYQAKKRSREPLGMNPPTPRRDEFQDENGDLLSQERNGQERSRQTPKRNILLDSEVNTISRPQKSSRTSSFVGSGGKARYYGDLRSSISSLNTIDHQKADDDDSDTISNYSRPQTAESDDSHLEVYQVDDDDGDTISGSHSENFKSTPGQWNGVRQTSNSTGHDLHSGYAGLGAEFGKGMGRRREVSGKVAEEGRGGGGFVTTETHGGVPASKASRGGAAGWARFKGM